MRHAFALSLTVFALLVGSYLWIVPSADGLPQCPCLEERYTTPGRTGVASTCNGAILDLRSQLDPLIHCNSCDQQLIRNDCYLSGGNYQTDGWYEYSCQSNCRE